MTGTEQKLYKQLVDKSTEAFTMAIEIYNKPTLKYRVEGFAFFICNAQELMLKAYLIKTQGESSIYYSDKESRSISLRDCITKILTNEKDPLRKNLECLVELRNTSTHFILPEYEILYAPLFISRNYINIMGWIYQKHSLIDSLRCQYQTVVSQMKKSEQNMERNYLLTFQNYVSHWNL